jgi:hypothetical protein
MISGFLSAAPKGGGCGGKDRTVLVGSSRERRRGAWHHDERQGEFTLRCTVRVARNPDKEEAGTWIWG